MYRGRPAQRGGYPPPYEGRGPPIPRPYPPPDYRDDRNRTRPSYHADFHGHGHPDPYRRSPPRRRFPSPGKGSHRGGGNWTGGPPRERSLSPRRLVPVDHKLVITVGNELTGPSGSSSRHDRDYHPPPDFERGCSRGRSRDRSPDRSRAKSRGRSKSRARSKSRPRSKSCSPNRSRAKSLGRSRGRSPDCSRAKSRGQSRSRTPDRSRAKSRGRSRSRTPDRSRAKSRGRSKSRPRSKSRSRSRSMSRGRSYRNAASHGRSKSRPRSRSNSRSMSSSSSSIGDKKSGRKEFKELETARRRKELEEMLSLPTKSILKKRNDSDDSPSLRSSDSPRALEGSNMSRVAEQLLLAVKGMEPHKVASVLSELQSDPRMAESIGLNAEIKEILNLLGGQAAGFKSQEKTSDDIDDEEKFLYGDSEEPKPPPASEPPQHQRLDLYGDVTEETLYGDYPPLQSPIGSQTFGLPLEASAHPQTSPTKMEEYADRPTFTHDQNIRIQVSNPAIPPGTEPLEESERQALEEYEKIQDLLKTIGLDLGVAEITKMAARTKERLHGSKPPPKTPTRRRRYSSGSSHGSHRSRRRRSHSSSSSSRSHSGGRGSNWSSDEGDRKSLAPPKSHKDRDLKETKAEQSVAAPPPHILPTPHVIPPHPVMPIHYPPTQVHNMMPPNFPPPGYGQYGNYLPYMHQQWPPMYPPPSLTLPPQTCPNPSSVSLPFNKMAPEPAVKGLVTGHVQDVEKENFSSQDRRLSEEQNNESQKQKVLEEREKLKQDREVRMKKKEYLMKELERLRKHQGELLRKKRREKGGHKDPLLQEISHLQEEVMIQISNLRREHEAAEKKRNEIEKVALILGLIPSDRPRKASKMEDEPPPPSEKDKPDLERSSKGGQEASTSKMKVQIAAEETSADQQLPSGAFPDKTPFSAQAPPATPPQDPFEYYDAGNHWCKNCNVTCGSMFDFFTHMHSKTHRKILDPYDRPWASSTKLVKNTESEEKLTKPAKGSEFLLPVRGFFCLLCREFYGDAICAEEHATTHAHNEKYKKQLCENPLYEQKRNLDRQAGLVSDTNGKKRKHEDDEKGNKDKEENAKHKKEKKEKDKNDDKHDADEDIKDAKSLEEEKLLYSKKDEDEKYKYSKKDDTQRYSREEEERGKYSRRDEEDKYKYSKEDEYKYRYRKGEDDRYDDRHIYGSRDDDKYKYSKYSDFRSKHDKDRDEGKPKVAKEAFKKAESGKTEVGKPQLPPRPNDQPKILCGPSPAMRAKLRKQGLESNKPASAASNPSFGKFTWRKKENVLASEAQKVAAEFIKDDEAGAKEDPFTKSIAYAKEIAEKLGSQPTVPPPWLSKNANRGRIRPNLRGPAAFLRRTAIMDKPAPLNTFLSIRPQNTSLQVSPPIDGPIFSDPTLLNTIQSIAQPTKPVITVSNPAEPIPKPAPLEAKYAPLVSNPAPGEAKPVPPVSKSATVESKAVAPVYKPAPAEAKPVPPVSQLAPGEVKPLTPFFKLAPVEAKALAPVSKPASFNVSPAPVATPVPFNATFVTPVSKPALFMLNPAPPVSKPVPVETKPVVSEAKPPQPTVVKIVSDVAAPGVPESEQIQTVFVKPPPFMAMHSGSQKSEKLKTNLAAAKAHDLFHIFYSSVGPSSTSITKPVKDHKAKGNNTCQSQPATPRAQKPQPHLQPPSQSQPPGVVCTSAKPDCPSPQTKTQSDIQISSVWSLQSIPDPLPEKPQFEITSPTTQPKLSTPVPSEAQSVPEKQSFTHNPQITPQTEPTTLDPTPQASSLSKPTHQEQPESLPEPRPAQNIQPPSIPETHPDTAPELKPSPKTRCKTTKKTPPAPRPVRQTRSQTRYQTQHQQQSQCMSEPEPAPGDSDSAVLDPKGLDILYPGSGLNPEEGQPYREEPHIIEVTPEAQSFPSDFTSLDFESDFNFE